ncbi:MAG: VWA domain-containing protein [Desulfobacteraceae bacterium]|nr:VWA domain-containing protein [Desulfobacteraceae bacterium]
MSLAYPWILYFLWLLPVAALALIVCNRNRVRTLERFADFGLLERLTEDCQKGKRAIKSALLLLGLGSMILALAGPRWGSHYQEVSRKGVDIMIVVDVSPSMRVEDIKPDRLERARREISDFLRVVQGDRVGLVAFSGVAFTQCPLTLDYGALQMFLNAVRTDLIPLPGTDLGGAIETAVSSFDVASETDKVILLITDGEDNEKRGLEAARKAAEKGIKIFVFGMGDPSGGPIPASEGKGGFRKDKEGQLVLSRLDEQGLKEIAKTTGGSYVRSVTGDLDLDLLYFDGIKPRTEDATLKSGKIKVFEERFAIFVVAAFFFLLLEGIISESGGRKAARTGSPFFFALLFLLVPLLTTRALGAENPDELYNQGRFAEAEKIYASKDMNNPKDIRYRYNRGCANYQNSNYKGAKAAFSSVLRRAKDKGSRFKAAYNLGNTAFKQGDLRSAAAYYKQAILLDPESQNARYNLELTLREIEKQNKENRDKDKQPQEGSEHPDKGKDNSKESKGENKKETSSKDGKSPSNKQDPALQPLPEKERDQFQGTAAAMDKKKAEALLDNITEDPSRFLKLQIPRDKQQGVRSGKDW